MGSVTVTNSDRCDDEIIDHYIEHGTSTYLTDSDTGNNMLVSTRKHI